MAQLCLSEEFIKVDFSGHKVWYDEANKQLILLKNNVYYTLKLSLGLGSRLSSPLNFVHAGNVLDVKFSLCRKFIAIQRSDMEIEVVDIERVAEWKLRCRSKRGNCVLKGGVLWLVNPMASKNRQKMYLQSSSSNTENTNLAMVTRFGLEIHKLPNRSRSEQNCKLITTVKYTVQCFWHLPQHQVILLATDTGQELRPFQFQNNSHPTKLAKFVLNSMPAPRDIVLAKLYDSIFCINIDTAASCMRLFRIGRQETQCTHMLYLYSSGSFGISTLDNLLCLHDMDAKVSTMYDIRASTNFACLAPAKLESSIVKPQRVEEIINVKVESDAIGLEFGPVDSTSNEEDTGKYAAMVTGVSSGESSVSKVAAGSVLISIDGKSMENVTFENVVKALHLQERPLLLQFRNRKKLNENNDGDLHPDESLLPATAGKEKELSENGDNSEGSLVKGEMDGKEGEKEELYASSWVFLPPYWVLDARLGKIWRLEIDMEATAGETGLTLLHGQKGPEKNTGNLCRDPRNLSDFLLRRTSTNPHAYHLLTNPMSNYNNNLVQPRAYGKGVLLRLIYAHLALGKRPLMTISMIFKSINDAYLMALRERSKHSPRTGNQSSNTLVKHEDEKSDTSYENRRKQSLSKSNSRSESQSDADLDSASTSTSTSASTAMNSLTREMSANQRLSLLRSSSFRKSRRKFEYVESETELDTNLLNFLDDFKGAEQVPLKDIRCYDGRAVVLQIDVFTWVFLKLIPDPIDLDDTECKEQCEWLATIVTEYVRSLHYHFIPIEQYMFELLSWLLILCRKEQTLHQLLQYHIPYDSNRLAETLLSASQRYEPLWQVSVDMLYRLSDYHLVIVALLRRRKLFQSLRLLMRFPELLHDENDVVTTSTNIHAATLFEVAIKICKEDDLDWNLRVFTALQSFFISIRPSLIRPKSVCDSDSTTRFECSPLAREAADISIDNTLINHLLGEKAEYVLRSFGFEDS